MRILAVLSLLRRNECLHNICSGQRLELLAEQEVNVAQVPVGGLCGLDGRLTLGGVGRLGESLQKHEQECGCWYKADWSSRACI